MPKIVKPSLDEEKALMRDLWSPEIADDPEAFVLYNYPWGKKDTPLEKFKGPRGWQRESLQELKQHIARNKGLVDLDLLPEMYREADASGRGIGKSAFSAWLCDWNMSCHIGSTTVVTANTEQQLKSRTWAELGKWRTLALNSHWFEWQALSLKPHDWFAEALKRDLNIDTGYYYAQAQLWSEENPDAFAGVHNPHGVMVIFDEASGIPAPIWTVTEGFFTEPEMHRYWFAFSNPRRNTGAFYECFHKYRDSWRRRHIDGRRVEGTDPAIYDGIIAKYGADSDEARIEVYGQFPKQGDKQFISREVINNAVTRNVEADNHAGLIMGVDVARFGGDRSVIRFRQGRDARSFPVYKYKGLDNMQLAYRCAEMIDKFKPDAVCIDAGNGTGVIDRLRDLGYKVHEVWFGAKSSTDEWANKRTEMWALMREWLGGGCIDNDSELIDDLAGPEYRFQGRSDKQMLEPKEDMKRRGMASPDDGDALACTFAVKVSRKDRPTFRGANRGKIAPGSDYDVLSH